MNTAKIAGLYAASHYATHQRLAGVNGLSRPELTQRLRYLIYHEDSVLTLANEPDWHYHVSVSDSDCFAARRLDFFGERQHARTDSRCTARVFAWAARQLPATDERAAPARCLVTLAKYAPRQSEQESQFEIRVCGSASITQLERGIRAYQRKRQRYTKKLLTQLAVYHQQQLVATEAAKLRQGVWLGAEKALTTAARVDEPSVSFLGDAGLSEEQHRALDLHYWAVPENARMGPGFPAGTGLALKPVKRSRELVDGAVYLYQYQLTEDCPLVALGRLDLSRKTHGMLPLFRDEALTSHLLTWAAWSSPKFRLFRVTHYTTRQAGAPTSVGRVLATEPAEVLHEELALAA